MFSDWLHPCRTREEVMSKLKGKKGLLQTGAAEIPDKREKANSGPVREMEVSVMYILNASCSSEVLRASHRSSPFALRIML